MRQLTSAFRNTQGIYWLAENLLASQEGLSSMELASFKNWGEMFRIEFRTSIGIYFNNMGEKEPEIWLHTFIHDLKFN